MNPHYIYRKSRRCVYAIDLDTRLPSGNVRVWAYAKDSSRIKFFGDELSRECVMNELEPVSEAEIAELKSEMKVEGLL